MEYTDQMPLVVAGRMPSFPERQYWQRLHSGLRRAAVWGMTLITAYFAYSAWETLFYLSFWEAILTAAVLLVPTLLMLWFPFYDKHERENALKTVWYNEQADKQRLSAGYTVALWDDRAVVTDLRGETTMLFADVTLCTETVHGFYLQAGTTDLLIRSADLTPEQATAVRALLQTVIPRERYRQKSTAMACLREALPFPVFQNDDTVVARATTRIQRPRTAISRMFVIPAGVIFGVMLAETVTLTAYYVADLLILAAVGAAVLCGALFVFSVAERKPHTVYIALTRDGVAAFENGHHYFLTWERVQLKRRSYSVEIAFKNGNSLKIPYSQFDNPQAILQIRKGDSYHG